MTAQAPGQQAKGLRAVGDPPRVAQNIAKNIPSSGYISLCES